MSDAKEITNLTKQFYETLHKFGGGEKTNGPIAPTTPSEVKTPPSPSTPTAVFCGMSRNTCIALLVVLTVVGISGVLYYFREDIWPSKKPRKRLPPSPQTAAPAAASRPQKRVRFEEDVRKAPQAVVALERHVERRDERFTPLQSLRSKRKATV